MKCRIYLSYICLLLTNVLSAQTYIVNVAVADVEHQQWMPNQTVTITKDLITEVLPAAQANVPKGATIALTFKHHKLLLTIPMISTAKNLEARMAVSLDVYFSRR